LSAMEDKCVGQAPESLASKFGSSSDAVEEQMSMRTVGLVSQKDYGRLRNAIEMEEHNKANKKKKKKKKVDKNKLSFGEEEEEEEDDRPKKFGKMSKDSAVDTNFLPDKEKADAIQKKKDELAAGWLAEQEEVKKEKLAITFSYHNPPQRAVRTKVECTKGTTILQFMEIARHFLKKENPELRGVSCDNLMYIKEDLIMPMRMTFWDFIVTKARGKSGPLFSFDVHEAQREWKEVGGKKVLGEAVESHPGKLITKSWYETNKGTFPASRWELYDPKKKWDTYTTGSSGIVRDEKGNEADESGKFNHKIA